MLCAGHFVCSVGTLIGLISSSIEKHSKSISWWTEKVSLLVTSRRWWHFVTADWRWSFQLCKWLFTWNRAFIPQLWLPCGAASGTIVTASSACASQWWTWRWKAGVCRTITQGCSIWHWCLVYDSFTIWYYSCVWIIFVIQTQNKSWKLLGIKCNFKRGIWRI